MAWDGQHGMASKASLHHGRASPVNAVDFYTKDISPAAHIGSAGNIPTGTANSQLEYLLLTDQQYDHSPLQVVVATS
jgi:hypothetical protein